MVLMTVGWDPAGDPTHKSWNRDLSCAKRVLEMSRIVKWFTSHTRHDSYAHEKVLPMLVSAALPACDCSRGSNIVEGLGSPCTAEIGISHEVMEF